MSIEWIKQYFMWWFVICGSAILLWAIVIGLLSVYRNFFTKKK